MGFYLLLLQITMNEPFSYTQSFEKLQQESGVSLKKHAVADNIDLIHILQVNIHTTLKSTSSDYQEYEDYYCFKFGKQPRLMRKLGTSPITLQYHSLNKAHCV